MTGLKMGFAGVRIKAVILEDGEGHEIPCILMEFRLDGEIVNMHMPADVAGMFIEDLINALSTFVKRESKPEGGVH